MVKLLSVACVALLSIPGVSTALEFKNIRPCYGTPLGATRQDTKLVPGDVLFITFDIDGLMLDDKTGKANYTTTFEVLDPAKKTTVKKEMPNQPAAQLGGTRMPGVMFVETTPTMAAGKYAVRLTVTDKLAKESKSFVYDYELLPAEFGTVGVLAPGIGFPGQNYVANFALVNMGLDKKKQPLVDVMMRVLDESGTKEVAKPIYSSLPKDLPDDANLEKENFVAMQFPVYLNRVGTFVVEINAADKTSNKKLQIRYTLTVVDVPAGK